jgi:hypothetical protein
MHGQQTSKSDVYSSRDFRTGTLSDKKRKSRNASAQLVTLPTLSIPVSATGVCHLPQVLVIVQLRST